MPVQASAALAKKSAPAERIAASVFAYRAAIMGGREKGESSRSRGVGRANRAGLASN